MTQLKLTYRGSKDLTDIQTEAPQLLEALLTAHADDSPLVVEAGEIRPDQGRVLVKLTAEGAATEIESVADGLAQSVADLGVETEETEEVLVNEVTETQEYETLDGETETREVVVDREYEQQVVETAQEVARDEIETRVV